VEGKVWLEVPDARRPNALEEENRKLKKLLDQTTICRALET